MTQIQKRLFEMQDLKYRDFHSRLMPNIDKDLVIGVRTPQLRKFAAEVSKSGSAAEFITVLPHKYYEENNLHAMLIGHIKDYDATIIETERFLPFIDNWATCDMFKPKIFNRNKDKLIDKIYEWIDSDSVYTVRYAIGMLMKFFLDEDFDTKYLDTVAAVKSDEYYINMMIAWYFATALAKQYDDAIKVIENRRLDPWTHNKAIQKAIESYRIDKGTKDYLRLLKIKG
ncbi:MAG: DNA alkylation repair protein [Eubacteriales bacterium]|nr:DNA alkylation repair protein [Eubacteriales bacterium]